MPKELKQIDGIIATLKLIGERINTQDNRCTSMPMFCVQVKRRIIGLDTDYCDGNTVWIDTSESPYEEVPEGTEGAEEFGYVDIWETKMVAFTEDACKEYLELNGHNLKGEKRIYVESFYRCPEMIAIRDALINLAIV